MIILMIFICLDITQAMLAIQTQILIAWLISSLRLGTLYTSEVSVYIRITMTNALRLKCLLTDSFT